MQEVKKVSFYFYRIFYSVFFEELNGVIMGDFKVEVKVMVIVYFILIC